MEDAGVVVRRELDRGDLARRAARLVGDLPLDVEAQDGVDARPAAFCVRQHRWILAQASAASLNVAAYSTTPVNLSARVGGGRAAQGARDRLSPFSRRPVRRRPLLEERLRVEHGEGPVSGDAGTPAFSSFGTCLPQADGSVSDDTASMDGGRGAFGASSSSLESLAFASNQARTAARGSPPGRQCSRKPACVSLPGGFCALRASSIFLYSAPRLRPSAVS